MILSTERWDIITALCLFPLASAVLCAQRKSWSKTALMLQGLRETEFTKTIGFDKTEVRCCEVVVEGWTVLWVRKWSISFSTRLDVLSRCGRGSGVLRGFAAWTEIKETPGQGHLFTCLLRQLSFIIICLSVLGSCYCSAIDLAHMVAILEIYFWIYACV